ncbi:hypothetical protein L6164_009131 [Bauhinia variegata]|uniref:Uncharacterized protein n=1 Tax=Bauhinia variegata TaxID=167791 RepID=A0ACB9PHQ6_BAUVA|nr:hypothetical protein L6164_009131 [Bauhinia variegata]
MSFQDIQGGPKGQPGGRIQSPSQAVAAGIFQINTSVGTFRRLVDAIGTVKDTQQHRRNLHNTRQRILQLVKDTSAKLKSLSESDHDAGISPNKKIQDAKLARDFQTILEEFQKVQQLANERESTYVPAAPPPSLPTSSAFGEESIDKDQERQPFLGEQKRQEILLWDNEISFNEAMIEEREQGIREVEEQIGEVNEIFKDLAVLVHEQGVVIDDIQSNIDSSAGATSQAKVQLSKASKSVKFRCSWCWWVLAVIVVALVIFLLVVIL